MDIKVFEEGCATVVSICGRLDTVTSPDLEKTVNQLFEEVKTIIFDCEGMDYISSAGLRVVLTTHKKCSEAGGRFVVRNLTNEVKTVFDMTGFSRLLNLC